MCVSLNSPIKLRFLHYTSMYYLRNFMSKCGCQSFVTSIIVNI
jgi:hypothetical protein